jgi:ABC-type amino acid transport substrate-binding protein
MLVLSIGFEPFQRGGRRGPIGEIAIDMQNIRPYRKQIALLHGWESIVMRFSTLLAGLGFCLFLAAPPALAESSTWNRVAQEKVLHVGLIPNRPPYQWKREGKDTGLAIRMGEDLAKALAREMGGPIRIDYVTSTWSTLVLDMQAGRIDVFFGMADSEERRKAIATFGPIYSVPVVAVNSRGFNPGASWAAYDDPKTQIATIMGTVDEQAAREALKKAKLRSFKSLAEASLDVQSGNASAMVTSILIALDAKKKNPAFASLTLPTPVQAFPSGGGAPRDTEGRYAAFLQKWAEEYRSSGRAQTVIMDAIAEAGLSVEDLPQGVKF